VTARIKDGLRVTTGLTEKLGQIGIGKKVERG
jgi:hypothetical protein